MADDFEAIAGHRVKGFAVCISSTANSIASRSMPRLIAFCIAEFGALR